MSARTRQDKEEEEDVEMKSPGRNQIQAEMDVREENLTFWDVYQLRDADAKAQEYLLKAQAYVKRIYKYGGLSPCNLIVALIFVDRFWTSVEGQMDNGEEVAFIPLSTRNFQRLFLVGSMLASKFWDGYYYSNAHWAEVAGITLQELNRLELKFLFGVAFRLQVGRDEYEFWCKAVRRLVAQKQEENQMNSMETKLLKAAQKWTAKNPDGHRPWRAQKGAEEGRSQAAEASEAGPGN